MSAFALQPSTSTAHAAQVLKTNSKAKLKDASSARDLIQIRCQQGEKASWQQEAKEHGLSLGDYVRLKMARKTRKHIPKTDPELIRQLAAIGNNINQLARAVNIYLR